VRLRSRDADDLHVDAVHAEDPGGVGQGGPPDVEADAIKRVLDQMETFAEDWSPEA